MVNIKKSYMKIKHRDIFTKEQIEEFVGEFVTINYKGLLDRKVLVGIIALRLKNFLG